MRLSKARKKSALEIEVATRGKVGLGREKSTSPQSLSRRLSLLQQPLLLPKLHHYVQHPSEHHPGHPQAPADLSLSLPPSHHSLIFRPHSLAVYTLSTSLKTIRRPQQPSHTLCRSPPPLEHVCQPPTARFAKTPLSLSLATMDMSHGTTTSSSSNSTMSMTDGTCTVRLPHSPYRARSLI
jgi:hypothetical protein